MLSVWMAIAALLAAGDGSSVVTIRREGSPGVTELSAGVAISSRHVVTLSAFAGPEAPPIVEIDGDLLEPDTIFFSDDLGLAILAFSGHPFDSWSPPSGVFPEEDSPIRLVGQGVTGAVSIGGRIIRQYGDGAVLIAAPSMDGLMGAAAFDSDGNLLGLIRGIVSCSMENRPGTSVDYLAMIPSSMWAVWADLTTRNRWRAETSFGVTATSFSSINDGERPSGILIVAVDDGSVACECGLRPGDLVTEVDSFRVYHPETLRGLLISAVDSLEALVWSRGETRTLRLPPLR